MPADARPRRPTARAESVALPRRPAKASSGRSGWALARRLAPSRRSVTIGIGILAVTLGAYAIARETSLFAVDRIDVQGGSHQVDAQVQQALAPLLGKSLVGLNGSDVLRRVEALPTVVSASYDRSFPNTLRIDVTLERPVAVLRAGASGWLVSRRGRVIETVAARGDAALPRIWLGAKTKVSVGEVLPPTDDGGVARALGEAGPFRSRIATASLAGGALLFRLRSGIELLLGAPAGIALKVAVATQALQTLPAGTRFLDVSVPGRPVSSSGLPALQSHQTSSRG